MASASARVCAHRLVNRLAKIPSSMCEIERDRESARLWGLFTGQAQFFHEYVRACARLTLKVHTAHGVRVVSPRLSTWPSTERALALISHLARCPNHTTSGLIIA